MPNNRAAASPKRAPCRWDGIIEWQLTEDERTAQRKRAGPFLFRHVRERKSEMVRAPIGKWLISGLPSNLLGQLLIHKSTVADSHQANDSHLLMNGIDDAKTADAIFS